MHGYVQSAFFSHQSCVTRIFPVRLSHANPVIWKSIILCIPYSDNPPRRYTVFTKLVQKLICSDIFNRLDASRSTRLAGQSALIFYVPAELITNYRQPSLVFAIWKGHVSPLSRQSKTVVHISLFSILLIDSSITLRLHTGSFRNNQDLRKKIQCCSLQASIIIYLNVGEVRTLRRLYKKWNFDCPRIDPTYGRRIQNLVLTVRVWIIWLPHIYKTQQLTSEINSIFFFHIWKCMTHAWMKVTKSYVWEAHDLRLGELSRYQSSQTFLDGSSTAIEIKRWSWKGKYILNNYRLFRIKQSFCKDCNKHYRNKINLFYRSITNLSSINLVQRRRGTYPTTFADRHLQIPSIISRQ